MKKTLVLLLCLVLAAAILPAAVLASNNFWLSYDGNSSSVHTYPGGDATLKVVAYGDDLEGVTYQWYSDYDSELGDYAPIEGATSDTLELKNVTEYKSYRCKAWDQYGNTDYVWMYVYTDNNFSLTTPDDGNTDVKIPMNGSATLQVIPTGVDVEGVTYQWSIYDESNYSYTTIEGATGDSYEVTDFAGAQTIRCTGTDKYQNTRTLYFNLSIDNQFTVVPEGAEEGSSYAYLYVDPRSTPTLNATVSALDMSDMTYQWYDANYNRIEGATGTSYTVPMVTAQNDYHLTVTDKYGESKSVYFYIYVDNALKAYPEGADENSSSRTYKFEPNSTPTLKAVVSAKDMEGLSYTWYEGSWSNKIEGADTDSLALPAVTGSKDYYLTIRDSYGNSMNLYFYVQVDNGFEVKRINENSSVEVAPGEDAELAVRVSAKDWDGLTIQWYNGDYDSETGGYPMIEGATGESYTVENVQNYSDCFCRVKDKYGNSNEIWFYVGVKNDLTVSRAGGQYVYVPVGGSVTLKPVVSAIDTEGLSYRWNDSQRSTTESVIVENVTKRSYYSCTVTDKFGNTDSTYWYVCVDNGFTAKPHGATNGSNSVTVYVAPGADAVLVVDFAAINQEGVEIEWTDNNWRKISGATGTSYTVSNVTKAVSYHCEITDKFGNNDTAYFNVRVDNGFSAIPDGNTGSSNSRRISVPLGENAALKVNAKANDMEGMTFMWQYYVYGEGYVTMPVDGDSYTVESVQDYREYQCRVTDKYGNSASCWFYVGVDNGFSAKAAGATGSNSSQTTLVPLGSSVDLKVLVTAIDKEGLTYEWHSNKSSEIDADGDSFTVEDVREYGSYYCYVTDKYGNNNTVWFYVGVDNGFSAAAAQQNAYAPLGGSAELKVVVTAKDAEGMTFVWRDDNYDEVGSGTDSYTVTNVAAYSQYRCTVTDKYGNNKTVWFYVGVDNGFSAHPEGGSRTSSTVFVPLGGETELKVVAEAIDTEGMTYLWTDNHWDPLPNGESDSYKVTDVTDYRAYVCDVTDKYGNSTNVWFYVGVENHLTITRNGASSVSVQPGESVTLSVTAAADDAEGLSYRWTQRVYNPDGDYYNSEDIEGATDTTLALTDIQSSGTYYCYVTDKYGTSKNVSFTVGIENGFTADWAEFSRYAPYGSPLTLTVVATANDAEGIRYRWGKYTSRMADGGWTNGVTIAGDGASYTVPSVTGAENYYCTVTDKFGNEQRLNAEIGIENGLSISRVSAYKTYVPYGSDATLSVSATATDAEGLRYQWSYYTPGEGYTNVPDATGTSCTVTNVTASRELRCTVTDKFGNAASVWIYVGPENGLSIAAVGGETRIGYTGEPVTLKVAVTATDPEGLSLKWDEMIPVSRNSWNSEELDVAGDTLTVDYAGTYRCTVTDKFGNNENVWFYVSEEYAGKNGLVKDDDGVYRYYKGGVLQSNYTGLVTNESGTFYVRSGILASDVSGMVTIGSEVCEIANGQLATWHSELVLYNNEWLYLNKGKIDLTYTGLAQNENGWWYVTDGHMNFDFIGLQTNEFGTWYVYKGQLVTWRDESVEEIDGNLYYCYKGQLCEWFTGLVPCGSDWIYVTKGVWDRSYTGLAQNANGWWYVFNGQLDLSYTGLAANENGTFYVYKGQLVTWHGEEVFCDWVDGDYYMFYKGQLTTWDTYPKLVYPGGAIEEWVPMIGGRLAPSFTGIAVNDNGFWYVNAGHMDFDLTGLVTNSDGTWYVYQGQLVTWKDGIQWIESEGKCYYIYQGQLAEWHTGDIEEGGVVYHVTNGVVTSWN